MKVRLAEHLHGSSRSTLTEHLLNNTDHEPLLKYTEVLACESHERKCKITESICIEHKEARLCNGGLLTEILVIWNLCARPLAQQLMD